MDHEHDCGDDCDCITTEDVVDHNNLLITALVEVLVTKGVISRDEFEAKIDELESLEDDTEEEESDEESDEPEDSEDDSREGTFH